MALVFLFNKVESLNPIKPLSIGDHQIGHKHLQFADDILLFVPIDEGFIWNDFRIWDIFGLMSGLVLNYEMSNIMRWSNTENAILSKICSKLCC